MKVVIRNGYVMIGLLFVHLGFASAKLSNTTCLDPYMIKIVDKAKKEMNNRMYLTLATVDNYSYPWNTPVYTAFDSKYHFYWMSSLKSQHSKNIRSNGKTFAVLYDSTVPEGTGFAVYLQGHSYELDSAATDEMNHAIAVMGARIHRVHLPPTSDYLPPFPRRIYKFIPRKVWVNTIVTIQGKKVDERLEITGCLFGKYN